MTTIEDPASAALAVALDLMRPRLDTHADWMLARTTDWQRLSKFAPESQADEGVPSDTALEDRRDDHAANRYHDELVSIRNRMLSDARRWNLLFGIVFPKQPRQITGKEMLDAQVAAEGWCISCWRWNQTVKEREKDGRGHFNDNEACDLCRNFKKEHGIYPPLDLLEVKHGQLKNWTTARVQASLEAHRRPAKKAP